MLSSVLTVLNCRTGGRYVDGTAGGGGYSEAILDASSPDGLLIALDWDEEAVFRVRDRLSRFENRVHVVHASYSKLPDVLNEYQFGQADGIVVDLGLSSFQLEDPKRGFSFIHDGPLDMRMDRAISRTAADLVNTLPERELANVIYSLGEERWSRKIARAIVSQRDEKPFSRTSELAELVRRIIPRTQDSLRIHPATRTFQALRLAVNRELDVLQEFLNKVLGCLKPEGRLCVVAFHSLEDRIVKRCFREWSKKCRCPKTIARCECEGALVKLITRKALRPDEAEVLENPRARSARLRAIEKN
jgi:16S rRNA (cytosine1402-N4)-methyltransferase